jgi:hypothetical protein
VFERVCVCVNVCVCVCVSVSVCVCVYGACDVLKCSSGLPLSCCVPAVHIMPSWLLSARLNVDSLLLHGSVLGVETMERDLADPGGASRGACTAGPAAAWPPRVFGHGLPS